MSNILSVRVPEALREQLRILSKVTNRTQSYLAAKALGEYVKRNAWKAKEISKAVEEANKGVFVSGEAVDEWLDSWGSDNELPPPEPDIFPK